HAIGLESDTGIEVLIHIGIDTVKLNGEGFESLVDVNEPVTQGQPLMKINLAYLKEHAPSVVTPVIITNQDDKTLTFDDVDSVDPGKRIMTIK
ncbi:MAG: PTS glucose transporter subunit IIA, partial [Staphylococcus sp.]|nr:PTS glucose transporter subunit IIA [Staphylococcus sp.]MDU4792537.1 PTS glucose transporter subunit IIA [Staphylococcus sp.]